MRQTFIALTAVLAGFLTLAIAQDDAAATTENVIVIRQHDELGPYLTDGAGMSLFLFLTDMEGGSTCYDDCAANWPPLLQDPDNPFTVGEGLDPELLGTVERDDGTVQVTYNRWPLYYFIRNQNAGDIEGQGNGQIWWLINPEGYAVGMEMNPMDDRNGDGGEDYEDEGRAYR